MNTGMSKVVDMLMYDILDYIRHHPQVTRHDLTKVFKVHDARIIRRTQYLEANGFIASAMDREHGRKLYTATGKLLTKPVQIQTTSIRHTKPRKTSSKPRAVTARESELTRALRHFWHIVEDTKAAPENEIVVSVISSNERYTVEIMQGGNVTHAQTFEQYDEALKVVNRVWDGEPLGKLDFDSVHEPVQGGRVINQIIFIRSTPLVIQ